MPTEASTNPLHFPGYVDQLTRAAGRSGVSDAEALRDGWFHTGDLASRCAGGYWQIVGRRSTDLIKTGGYKVGAGEIEVALADHPIVIEAAGTGEPDRERS